MVRVNTYNITFIISFFGMIGSIVFLWDVARPWAFAFAIAFFIIFISSLIGVANVHDIDYLKIGMRKRK